MVETYFFFFLKILAIFSTILVVNVKNPVQSVLLLVTVFCSIASILLLLNVHFLAFVYLVVYVGAIAVLFLFIVMMLNIRAANSVILESNFFGAGFTLLVTFFTASEILRSLLVTFSFSDPVLSAFPDVSMSFIATIDNYSTLNTLGLVLFTFDFFPFLLAGFILLLAMFGAILLTLSHAKGVRRQDILKQTCRNTVINKLNV